MKALDRDEICLEKVRLEQKMKLRLRAESTDKQFASNKFAHQIAQCSSKVYISKFYRAYDIEPETREEINGYLIQN